MTETENVQMTAEERAEFEAFRAEKEKKRREEERRRQREEYAGMVDDEIEAAIPQLLEMSEALKAVKAAVYSNFAAVLAMKEETLGIKKDDQRSHTFTNSKGTMRLTLGVYTVDGYRDTVEDGIEMVKKYLESLAKDDSSRLLVGSILQLLSRDKKGTIKASRVLQLRRLAEKSGDGEFIEGVRIIEEAYQPTVSKRYIRAEVKNDEGAWINIPLGMTDVD